MLLRWNMSDFVDAYVCLSLAHSRQTYHFFEDT